MSYHILIADDEENGRAYLRTILEERGHKVTEAKDGEQAFDLFQKHPYDLLISDIKMPKVDGLSLLQQVKQEKLTFPVMMISAFQDSENVLRALKHGAYDFIVKPYQQQDIYQSLDRVAILKKQFTDHPCCRYLMEETQCLVFDNDPAKIQELAYYLTRNIPTLSGSFDTQSIILALIEALNNAVVHGNLELSIPSDMDDKEALKLFSKELYRRQSLSPYNDRKVYITYTLDRKKVSYHIRDEGKGFDYQHLPDPTNPVNLFKLSGRGILMISSFCDEVHWNECGNEISLVKHFNCER